MVIVNADPVTGGGNIQTIPDGDVLIGSTTVVEIDFGANPTRYAQVTVIDANVTTTSSITATQSGNAATGKSADENEMDPISFSAKSGTGSFVLNASSREGPVSGKFKVNYSLGV